jgi:two-component system chemotaxis response regulator CheB
MQKDWPDVIVSDLEMPGMHGLEFLRYIRANRPTPFVVCSSHVGPGAQASLDALALGAVDIISKPNIGVEAFLEEITASITQSVKAAAQASTTGIQIPAVRREGIVTQQTVKHTPAPAYRPHKAVELIAVGSSTGGTVIVEHLLKSMTLTTPGLLIVQHMPKHFTELFAKRLNSICTIDVREARDGDDILPGRALIAPGGLHMKVIPHAHGMRVKITDDAPVNRHRPSVDVLFRSVAEHTGSKSIGVILTGMGEDGAQGLLAMRQKGALTIGQDLASSAVYGMPRVAMEIGAVEHQMPSSAMPDFIQHTLAGAT